MPFAAFCKKCKHYMIGKKLYDIRIELNNHYKNSHNTTPQPEPYKVDFGNDFKPNLVELFHSIAGRNYWFTSRRFCSQDYCIALITNDDYDDLNPNDPQSKLSNTLNVYFE